MGSIFFTILFTSKETLPTTVVIQTLFQVALLFKLYFKSHVCGSHTYLYKDNIGGKCDNICSYMENESTDLPMHATKIFGEITNS